MVGKISSNRVDPYDDVVHYDEQSSLVSLVHWKRHVIIIVGGVVNGEQQ